ncbi:MAG: SAM-dependent methyltransferase, partial [Candidatus Dormibacteria bacterium]
DTVRWRSLATGSDTIVILMGARRLAQICASLMDAGRSPSEPAAIVMSATQPCQQEVVATLGTIACAADALGVRPPAILVVGEVCGVAAGLRKDEVASALIATK